MAYQFTQFRDDNLVNPTDDYENDAPHILDGSQLGASQVGGQWIQPWHLTVPPHGSDVPSPSSSHSSAHSDYPDSPAGFLTGTCLSGPYPMASNLAPGGVLGIQASTPPEILLPHQQQYPDFHNAMQDVIHHYNSHDFNLRRLVPLLLNAHTLGTRLLESKDKFKAEPGPGNANAEKNTPRYTCCICPTRNFYSRGTLKRHISDTHYHEYRFFCPYCDLYVHRKDKIREHWKNGHCGKGELSRAVIDEYSLQLPAPSKCHFCRRPVTCWEDFWHCVLDHCIWPNVDAPPGIATSSNRQDRNDDDTDNSQHQPRYASWGNPDPSLGTYGSSSQPQGGGNNSYMHPGAHTGYRAFNQLDECNLADPDSFGTDLTSDTSSQESRPLELRESSDLGFEKKSTDDLGEDESSARPKPTLGDNKFREGIVPSEANETPQRKCQNCGHLLDGCSECEGVGAAVFACHECASGAALRMADSHQPVEKSGQKYGLPSRSYSEKSESKGLDPTLIAQSLIKVISNLSIVPTDTELEADQTVVFTTQRAKIEHNDNWTCDIGISVASITSHQFRILQYFEHCLFSSQRKGGFLSSIRETLVISAQQSMLPSAQDIGFQKVTLASASRPDIPGEHFAYLAREKNYASFDSELQKVRQASPKKRPHLRVRVRAIAGILALRASVSKTPPTPDNTDTDGCELGIPLPLLFKSEDVVKMMTLLVHLLFIFFGIDTQTKPEIYVITGEGNWDVPSLTYPN